MATSKLWRAPVNDSTDRNRELTIRREFMRRVVGVRSPRFLATLQYEYAQSCIMHVACVTCLYRNRCRLFSLISSQSIFIDELNVISKKKKRIFWIIVDPRICTSYYIVSVVSVSKLLLLQIFSELNSFG